MNTFAKHDKHPYHPIRAQVSAYQLSEAALWRQSPQIFSKPARGLGTNCHMPARLPHTWPADVTLVTATVCPFRSRSQTSSAQALPHARSTGQTFYTMSKTYMLHDQLRSNDTTTHYTTKSTVYKQAQTHTMGMGLFSNVGATDLQFSKFNLSRWYTVKTLLIQAHTTSEIWVKHSDKMLDRKSVV